MDNHVLSGGGHKPANHSKPDDSTRKLVGGVCRGEAWAVTQFCERWFPRLRRFCDYCLRRRPSPLIDGDDVAVDVLVVIVRRAAIGELAADSSTGIWRVLRSGAHTRLKRQHLHDRRFKRDSAQTHYVTGERLAAIADDQVGPEIPAELLDEIHLVMDSLRNETLRDVFRLSIEGVSPNEIGTRLHISPRSVRRKQELIRNVWLRRRDPESRPPAFNP